MNLIDLHVHSTASDGTYTPSELVVYALKKGLKAMALTDHDTFNGLAEARKAAQGTSLELVSGMEFSTEYLGRDVHILGLDLKDQSPDFASHLAAFQASREGRNLEMLDLLRTREGLDISLPQLKERFPGAVITRAHYAQYMIEKGYVKNMKEAFDRYIGDHCRCFVPRKRIRPEQAIALILKTGGIPILAHPLLYHLTDTQLETLVQTLKENGLQGLEAIYSCNMGMDESHMRRLARRFDLKISGGSDFHGPIKPDIDLGCGRGNLKIPYEILEELRTS